MRVLKPMKTADELITHLKDKGVKFTITSEDDAKKHLAKHNNYFKLSSYRKNYTKKTNGPEAGQYENLEFAYLVELARLDTEFRHIILQMSLDIEHFLKVALIKAVEDRMALVGDEDGYEIVKGFLLADELESMSSRAEASSKRCSSFSRKISQNRNNPYCGGLIKSYSDEMPVWTFVELASFGDIKDLVSYYSEKTGWQIPSDIKSLDRVRQLRNASAHGNCIINDLNASQTASGVSSAPKYITDFVKNAGIGKASMLKKLSNPRINQLVHLFYVYDCVVTSDNTRKLRLSELNDLFDNRCTQNAYFFDSNQMLTSTYDFFKKIIGNLE